MNLVVKIFRDDANWFSDTNEALIKSLEEKSSDEEPSH